MRRLTIHPTGIQLRPNSARVLVRPFIPSDPARIVNILGRALVFSESEVEDILGGVMAEFGNRHQQLKTVWERTFERVQGHLFTGRPLSEARRLLIGALFCGEYALESAALFN